MTKIRSIFRATVLGAMAAVLVACGSGADLGGDLAVSAKSAPTTVSPGWPPSFVSAPIPGRYIVVFKQSVGNPAAEAANVMRGLGGQVHFTYSHAIKGFAATIPEAALQGILRNSNVDYVEQDQTVAANEDPAPTVQSSATWGLDRIDQRALSADNPLDNNYHYNYTGAGVYAFIIDTGIRASHDEFKVAGNSRVNSGENFVVSGKGRNATGDPLDTDDCNGHGTHVAGTVGGKTYGVAKGVTLIPVRVLDCRGSGSWSGVIAGIDYVAGDTRRPAVANMSLGGGASNSVDTAVNNAVDAGVTMVVAAGNDGADACNYSPARAPSAITVGATGSSDARTSWSNYGTCVDIFAPGLGITSAWNTSDSATNTISGTSMASPHVTGVAALALAEGTLPKDVAGRITNTATPAVVGSAGTGSPDKLLYSLLTVPSGTVTDPVTPPPTQAVRVDELSGVSKKLGRKWRAEARVTILAVDTGSAVANSTVQGEFSLGGGGTCVSGSDGACTITSYMYSTDTTETDFTVTLVDGIVAQCSATIPECKVQITYP